MTPQALVREPASRRLSPCFFLLALLCCFFSFAAVSCNTAATRAALNSSAALGARSTQSPQLNACLDALNGVELFSYSGFGFMFGLAPSALTQSPAACRVGSAALPAGSANLPAAADVGLGVQPLALAAFIAIVLGAAAGAAGVAGVLRAPMQLLVSALLALVAILLLVLDQAHVQTAILARLDTVAAGSGAPFSLAGYFIVSTGAAYFLALAALGLGVLYDVTALLFRPVIVVDQPRAPDSG